jgi:hypothetical protein
MNKKYAIQMAIAIFSHWIFDIIVHRPDMPLLPGDRSVLLGFGLWQVPILAWNLEMALVIVCWFIYYRAAKQSIMKHADKFSLAENDL